MAFFQTAAEFLLIPCNAVEARTCRSRQLELGFRVWGLGFRALPKKGSFAVGLKIEVVYRPSERVSDTLMNPKCLARKVQGLQFPKP